MGQDRWGADGQQSLATIINVLTLRLARAIDRPLSRSGGLARLVLPELGALAATFATAATPIVKCMRAS